MKLVSAVREVPKIAYQNVVRKRATFYYTELQEHLKAFLTGIVDAGYTITGPLFYSLNNVPLDKMTDIEFFMPIAEGVFSLDGYRFSSYFIIEDLLKTRVVHDFETLTEQAYALLLNSIEENDVEINTPFYHLLPSDGSSYVDIHLGYAQSQLEVSALLEQDVFGF